MFAPVVFLGTMRNIILIIVSVVFYGEFVSAHEMFGYLMALTGFVGYVKNLQLTLLSFLQCFVVRFTYDLLNISMFYFAITYCNNFFINVP